MKKREEELEKVVISLKNKNVILYLTQYNEIDSDDITSIHYHNLMGEMLTCSVVLNRIGNLRAEAESVYAETKLDLDIYQAQREEELRKDLTKENVDSKGSVKLKPPTGLEIESAIKRSPEYKVKKGSLIDSQKLYNIMDSLYWAVKDKNDKLNRLSEKLQPEDFEKELIEGTVNGIQVKMKEKVIKDGK